MYSYIKKGTSRPIRFTQEMSNTGSTIDDYNNCKFIHISDDQAVFYLDNPNASFDEIMNMELLPVVPPFIPIEEQYKQRVKELISEKYDIEEELRILFNGETDPAYVEHENFVNSVKQQVKQELGITSNLL